MPDMACGAMSKVCNPCGANTELNFVMVLKNEEKSVADKPLHRVTYRLYDFEVWV